MRIAVWHNLPSGGGKRALHDHVRGLVDRGHTLESWCPSSADQAFLPLRELITEHVVPFSWEPMKARNSLNRGISLYRDVVNHLAAIDRHCQQCAVEINRGGFDLLLAHACMFFHAPFIGRYVKAPKVLYLQEPYRWLYEAAPTLPWAALPKSQSSRWSPGYLRDSLRDMLKVQGLRVQAREESINARTFDVILVNSFFSRESILRAYGVDAKVCYLGIDTEKFVYRNQPREEFVIGLGAIMPRKNIKLVIEALSRVGEPRPPLVWVGDAANADYLENLRRLAHSFGVLFEPRISVDDKELVDLLNRALVMVYAPRLEPFGFAPLEANACGLPVIAVAEGGVRETVTDKVNGIVVEHDPQAIASAVEFLLNDREYACNLGQQGRCLVEEQWSLEAAVDRLEDRLAQAACRKVSTDGFHRLHRPN